MSVKMWQSEAGMTGDPSRNVEVMQKVSDLLDNFEHDHDNETVHDSYLLIAGVKMGERIRLLPGEADQGIAVVAQLIGCTSDICAAFTGFLVQNMELIEVFEFACNEARRLSNPLNNDYETLN